MFEPWGLGQTKSQSVNRNKARRKFEPWGLGQTKNQSLNRKFQNSQCSLILVRVNFLAELTLKAPSGLRGELGQHFAESTLISVCSGLSLRASN